MIVLLFVSFSGRFLNLIPYAIEYGSAWRCEQAVNEKHVLTDAHAYPWGGLLWREVFHRISDSKLTRRFWDRRAPLPAVPYAPVT